MGNFGILFVSVFTSLFWTINGHGRMNEPPQRSSAWRYGFKTPKNYNDNELNCGGFTNMMAQGGRCGPCGDPWQGPRDNEAGGKYGVRVITRQYAIGQSINVSIQLTTNHKGYFEFRLCPESSRYSPVTQACLDRHLLNIQGHGTRYHIASLSSNVFINLFLSLPPGVACTNCVLQWKWRAAQNRGPDGKGGECFGCGPQEYFINCADVAIGNTRTPLPLSRPSIGGATVGFGSTRTVSNIKPVAKAALAQGIQSAMKSSNTIPLITRDLNPLRQMGKLKGLMSVGSTVRYRNTGSVNRIKPAANSALVQEINSGMKSSFGMKTPNVAPHITVDPNPLQQMSMMNDLMSAFGMKTSGHNNNMKINSGIAHMFGGQKEQETEFGFNPFMRMGGFNPMAQMVQTNPTPVQRQSASKPVSIGQNPGQGLLSSPHALTAAIMAFSSTIPDGTNEADNYEGCSDGYTRPTCKGHNTWNKQQNFDSWCATNCPSGTCPSAVCVCTCPRRTTYERPVHRHTTTQSYRCRSVPIFSSPQMDKWCEKQCIGNECSSDFCYCE